MASNLEFVEYVCEQISDSGTITYRKMFGDYGVYCNAKIIGLRHIKENNKSKMRRIFRVRQGDEIIS
ncbi:TfoX/Sxy family protein [Clostridium uliginosum]|uniref:Uncharacterized protein n=1 Tax=Clostridium uliginosum TaxID=119641 RepID=A0A1I1RBZ5_9CLOT|nr:hypothetical protein SAMN05421842_1324 [Clostridium uliginosum]